MLSAGPTLDAVAVDEHGDGDGDDQNGRAS